MGKSALMEGLAALDGKYGIARTIASRDPRPDDKPGRYTYYPHTDGGLAPLLAKIENRELLQYVVIPGSLSIRGSEAGDYPYEYNLGDVLSSAMPAYRNLGFGRLDAISIISEPAAWQQRFDTRFPVGHPDRRARLEEAATSIAWSLAQTGKDHYWTINHEGKLAAAIQAAHQAITHGQQENQAEAQGIARRCLEHIKELLA